MIDFPQVAKILPDREIKALLGKLILDGVPECVRPTSYEVRLGKLARFDSTGEEVEIKPGFFLEIQPGELVIVASLERVDFSRRTLESIGKPGLVAFITPTTTMMREGFLFASTKIDPGYSGVLNWGIRNSSIKPVQLEYGERLFKLTFFELQSDEVPDKFYGEDQQRDHYQDTDGIRASARMIPVQISDSRIMRRSEKKIDPKQQLKEAGPPLSYLSTELIELQGRFEIVSREMALVKDGFATLEKNIEDKIDAQASSISAAIAGIPDKIDTKIRATFAEQFGLYFDQKMMRVYGSVATIVVSCFALYKLLIQTVPSDRTQGWVLLGVALICLLGTLLLTRGGQKPKQSP